MTCYWPSSGPGLLILYPPGDALKLYRDFRILTNGLVDLGALARTTNAKELTGYVGLSLKLLCGIFVSTLNSSQAGPRNRD